MTDVYATPSANLTVPLSIDGYGSLERGKSGQFNFSIREIFSEAWAKTKGNKLTLWIAYIIYFVVTIVVTTGIPMVFQVMGFSAQIEPAQPGQAPDMTAIVGFVVSQIIIMLVTLPLGAGLFMMGLKIAVGVSVSATEIFSYFHKTLTLLATVILFYILVIIGLGLLILPGIYLAVAYYLALPLIVDKGLGVWQSLETSRKGVTHRWFRFLGLFIALGLLMMVAAIPLGIGLIWVLPMATIAYGIAYRNIFGYGPESAAK